MASRHCLISELLISTPLFISVLQHWWGLPYGVGLNFRGIGVHKSLAFVRFFVFVNHSLLYLTWYSSRFPPNSHECFLTVLTSYWWNFNVGRFPTPKRKLLKLMHGLETRIFISTAEFCKAPWILEGFWLILACPDFDALPCHTLYIYILLISAYPASFNHDLPWL